MEIKGIKETIDELHTTIRELVMPYLDHMIIMRIKISHMKSTDYSEESLKRLEESYRYYTLEFLETLEGFDPFKEP